jgi:hypothetical protein
MLLREEAQFELAVRLRAGGAPLGEIYSFISGLYFRGKMVYSQAFGPSVVITPGAGLLPPGTLITQDKLRELASIDIHENEPRFRKPLEEDACRLAQCEGPDCDFVLLGSIATAKYLEPLLDCFGDRLLFPEEFIGRGDMSRGGLMLRSASEGVELTYIPARGAIRRGRRPPKLPSLRRPRSVL